MTNDNDSIIEALADIADAIPTASGYRISDYAPDSSEYDGTEPGGEWDDECERMLKEVQAALPVGWVAAWSDNDIAVERSK